MAKAERPFLIVNPKSYLYGQKSLELALAADKTAAETGLQIFFTCPYADIRLIRENTSHVVVCAQSLDPLTPGRGMGHVLPESLKEAGADAVFLNHAENPKTVAELSACVKRAKELDMITVVCADSTMEAAAVACLDPDIVLAEHYREMRECGFDYSFSHIYTYKDAIQALDLCAQVGMKSVFMCPELKTEPEETVRRVRKHPGLGMYFLRDEPRNEDLDELGEWAHRIMSEDITEKVGLPQISFDHYPIMETDGVVSLSSLWYENLELVSAESRRSGKPFWAFALSSAHWSFPGRQINYKNKQIYFFSTQKKSYAILSSCAAMTRKSTFRSSVFAPIIFPPIFTVPSGVTGSSVFA